MQRREHGFYWQRVHREPLGPSKPEKKCLAFSGLNFLKKSLKLLAEEIHPDACWGRVWNASQAAKGLKVLCEALEGWGWAIIYLFIKTDGKSVVSLPVSLSINLAYSQGVAGYWNSRQVTVRHSRSQMQSFSGFFFQKEKSPSLWKAGESPLSWICAVTTSSTKPHHRHGHLSLGVTISWTH